VQSLLEVILPEACQIWID